MGKLWAVENDENTHVGGELNADQASAPQTVFINGKPVIVHPSTAGPDGFGHPPPPTDTANGSGSVFCYGAPAHRQDDNRQCGATTVVLGQDSVFVGD